MSFWGVVGIIALVVVVLLLINHKAVLNMFGALRAQVGKAGRAVGGADPLANYQQGIDDAADSVKRAKQGMTRAVALISSVERQVNSGKQEKARLEARIQRALGEENQAKAQEYAAQLADCETHLAANEDQLNHHKEAYDGFVADVKRQQEKVATYQREASGLGIQLEMSKANREFNEFRQSFTVNTGALNGLAAQREAVMQQIDQNNAYGKVEKDVGGGSTYEEDDAEIDRKIKADEILKRFQPQKPAAPANS
jgi:phage shock protein A